jgi:predicted RNase H-like nuclease (RuvC/YqgF family)
MTNDLDTAKERYVYHRLRGLDTMEAADAAGYSAEPPPEAQALYKEACRDPHRSTDKIEREIERLESEREELKGVLDMVRTRLEAIRHKLRVARNGELATDDELADVMTIEVDPDKLLRELGNMG